MPLRETKEFITPAGRKIVLRTYLTGREANEIKAAMFSALKMNMDDAQSGKVNVGDMSGTFLIEQERKALDFLLVSIDGDIMGPVEKLLELPSTEYEAVIKEVNAIQNPTKPENVAQHGADISQAA
jgi:hypothetical protein